MALYVEPLANYGMIYNYRGEKEHHVKSCHLICDGELSELLSFVKLIGMKTRWMHRSNKGLNHFDLMRGKRLQAVKYGAIELSLMEWNKKTKEIIAKQ